MDGEFNGSFESLERGSWLLGGACMLFLYHASDCKKKNVSPTQNLWTSWHFQLPRRGASLRETEELSGKKKAEESLAQDQTAQSASSSVSTKPFLQSAGV